MLSLTLMLCGLGRFEVTARRHDDPAIQASFGDVEGQQRGIRKSSQLHVFFKIRSVVTYSREPSGEGLNVRMNVPLKSWYTLHGCQVRSLVKTYGPDATLALGDPARKVRVSLFQAVNSSKASNSMMRSSFLLP